MSQILKPTAEQLKEILEKHKKWIWGEEGGERAYLSGAYLSGAYLSGAYLSGAYLSGADLRRAYLSDADLSDADLSDANLSRANLSDADLSDANLSRANLSDANLSGAYLSDANLKDAVLPPTLIVPEEGAFIGWKKAYGPEGEAVLKLRIEAEAMRVNSTLSRKCRASKVTVLAAYRGDGTEYPAETEFRSGHDPRFKYRIGQVAEVPDANPDFRDECTRGIHFFLTRAEAVAW